MNLLVAVFSLVFSSVFCADVLPERYERCPVSAELDNKPNECLKHAITTAMVELTDNGTPELNAKDLDPMQIKYIKIHRGGDSPVAITLIFKNNTMTGLSGFNIKEINGKLSSANGFHMVVRGSTPVVILAGPYKISGKVLVLPIQGEGMSNITMKNIKILITVDGEPKMKDGKEYLYITSLKMVMEPGKLIFNLGNLFNGNKALGDNTNLFLNNNWKDIYNELRPSIEESFGNVFREYARGIFDQVPFGDVFLVQ